MVTGSNRKIHIEREHTEKGLPDQIHPTAMARASTCIKAARRFSNLGASQLLRLHHQRDSRHYDGDFDAVRQISHLCILQSKEAA